jgi:hypothetical protein
MRLVSGGCRRAKSRTIPGCDVLDQGVDRGESLVAGARVVAAVVLEVAQERDDPLKGEIGDREPGDL